MLMPAMPVPDGRPLTHVTYMEACRQLATRHGAPLRPWIQVRKRFGGDPLVLCGQVIEIDAGRESGEWFKADTELGPLWVESRHVRLCSGDGRCSCEADARCRGKCPAPGTATRCETSRSEIEQASRIAAGSNHART